MHLHVIFYVYDCSYTIKAITLYRDIFKALIYTSVETDTSIMN